MKKFKMILIFSILLTIYILVSAYSYVLAISDNLYNSVFRLHVIANSDSEYDQNLKYQVRDNLLEYLNSNLSQNPSKNDVINFLEYHIDDLKNISQKTVKLNGFDYPVSVEIGNFEFPTKNYGDISLPAGYYDALRVKIGSANGKNWWCVMFPPLCFIDTTNGIVPDSSKESLRENLNDENYKIVSDTSGVGFSFKFKFIEIFEKTGLITAKK